MFKQSDSPIVKFSFNKASFNKVRFCWKEAEKWSDTLRDGLGQRQRSRRRAFQVQASQGWIPTPTQRQAQRWGPHKFQSSEPAPKAASQGQGAQRADTRGAPCPHPQPSPSVDPHSCLSSPSRWPSPTSDQWPRLPISPGDKGEEDPETITPVFQHNHIYIIWFLPLWSCWRSLSRRPSFLLHPWLLLQQEFQFSFSPFSGKGAWRTEVEGIFRDS